ncbi:unnamed protein product [Caenorhabditis sp. 36 PRJEB53466]|nr:unnamed protein product [Caenorhabditis sp. 36 PRJEB53466]
MKSDPKCMVKGRELMSCPKKDPKDASEKLICIEAHDLCDDRADCHNGEDEDPHFCMFKKLEDAEMRRIKNEIRLLTLSNPRKHPQSEFTDIVVNNDEQSEERGVKQPSRPGVFKLKAGSGPLAKSKLKTPQFNQEEYSEEDEDDDDTKQEKDDEPEVKQKEEEAKRHAKRRRAYRHLLELKAARL